MNIQINKQVELMCGLLQCSDYVKNIPIQCEDTGNEFRKNNIGFLSQFKDEKVFSLLNELINDKSANFTWEAPINIALHMDEHYNFFGHNSDTFVGKLHSNEKVLDFLDELKKFAEKVDYSSFFKQHDKYFKHIIDEYKEKISSHKTKVFEFMKKFYMFEPDERNFGYNLLLSVSWTSTGTQVGEKVFHSTSLKQNKKKEWVFIHQNSIEEFISNILHEFSHPIINPMTDKQKISPSFVPDWSCICDKLGVGYAGYFTPYINESLIRAIQIYFLEKVYNYPTDERILREERNGYFHTRELLKKLYELENIDYENFEDKYIDLINVFTKEIDKDIILQ